MGSGAAKRPDCSLKGILDPMRIPQNARDNLHLLTAEVAAQCLGLRKALLHADTNRFRQILDRAGYVANFKSGIQTRCIEAIAANGKMTERHRVRLTETAEIAHQLERITDKFRDISRQFLDLQDHQSFPGSRFKTPLSRIRETVIALQELPLPPADNHLAIGVSQSAQRIERQAKKLHCEFVAHLQRQPQNITDLSQGLLMANAVRQIGNALQEISECLLSIQLGQSMNMDRFRSLQAVKATHPGIAETQVTTVAETRSGSAVAGLVSKEGGPPAAIFKDGLKRKLKKERQGVENWHSVFPGLAPRILAYDRQGNQAALLIEHLPGVTFEQCLAEGSDEQLEGASAALRKTLQEVWRTTLSPNPVSASFMGQLQRRLPDIKSTHPEALADGAKIGTLRYSSFEQVVKRAAVLEKAVSAPFSVYIHGDFNVDNVIYDANAHRIHFIDLHRSQYMDYIQDVSVFVVSCFRQPRWDTRFRQRVWRVCSDMNKAARRFARQNGDQSYEFRLALGLARSLATSTRFVADPQISRNMLARSRYLLERVLETDSKRVENFRVPLKELIND